MPMTKIWSPLAQLMWAIAFFAVLAGMYGNMRRSDEDAGRDVVLLLVATLILSLAYAGSTFYRRGVLRRSAIEGPAGR